MFKDTMTAIPLSFLKILRILDTHIFVTCSLVGLFKSQNGGFPNDNYEKVTDK